MLCTSGLKIHLSVNHVKPQVSVFSLSCKLFNTSGLKGSSVCKSWKKLGSICSSICIILGQKGYSTNYCLYFQGIQCLLELTGAHVCWWRHQGTKCSEKCQSILNYIRVNIYQYSIWVNWNAVHCCACPEINFVVCLKVHNAGFLKNSFTNEI